MLRKHFSTRVIVEAGLMLGLATALSYIKIYSMPAGGSVTAGSMIPIILLALLRGPVVGITVGLLYGGVIQFYQEPYFLTPLQFLLDYPLAFGALGLAGFFWTPAIREKIGSKYASLMLVAGTFTAVFGRFVFAFLAGVVFWLEMSPYSPAAWAASATYNGIYLIPEVIISILLIIPLVPALTRILRRN